MIDFLILNLEYRKVALHIVRYKKTMETKGRVGEMVKSSTNDNLNLGVMWDSMEKCCEYDQFHRLKTYWKSRLKLEFGESNIGAKNKGRDSDLL